MFSKNVSATGLTIHGSRPYAALLLPGRLCGGGPGIHVVNGAIFQITNVGTSMSAIDVVIVPDFAGSGARVFEARMLLFLGSWLEYAGASRSWPLHMACIGEPPQNVRALAEQCSASITIHENLNTGDNLFMNKYRGFEIEPKTELAFLIDCDTLVLGDLSPLLELGVCLAGTPTYQNRIPLPIWQELYAELGVKMPEERILCLRGELADRLPPDRVKGDETHEMPPYYNGGVLLIPWKAGLREVWEPFTKKVNSFYRDRGGDWISVSHCDQASLAVTLTKLRDEGIPFKRLPDRCHANRWFYWAGAVTDDDARLFHAIKLFRLGDRSKPLDIHEQLELFERYLMKGVYPNSAIGKGKRFVDGLLGSDGPPAAASVRSFCRRLRALCETYVIPAMRGRVPE